jgi:hypothetical protein
MASKPQNAPNLFKYRRAENYQHVTYDVMRFTPEETVESVKPWS